MKKDELIRFMNSLQIKSHNIKFSQEEVEKYRKQIVALIKRSKLKKNGANKEIT